MDVKTLRMTIQLRRDTTANWEANKTTIPAAGEPCFDYELNILKIGDGETSYENLEPIGADSDAIAALSAKMGEVEEGKTLVQMIAEAKAAATYDDTQVKADIKANADAIAAIEADYLKAEDKYDDTALAGKVTTVEGAVAVLEGKAHEHANKDVIDGVTAEKVAAWDAAEQNAVDRVLGYLAEEEVNTSYDTLKEVAAWIESDTTASAELVTRVSNLEKVGAEKNVIAAVDTAQFAIDENRNLTLLDIAMGKVTGLQDALDAKANKGTTLAEYGITDAYTKEETLDKIAEKITEVNGGESAGEVLGQLNSYKETNDARVGTIEGQIAAIEAGAQVNKIESVKIGDTVLEIVDKVVTIPVATSSALGVVKGSDEIQVGTDGTMSVGTISLAKIDQGSVELILDGGASAK